jgi:hypothetical protein
MTGVTGFWAHRGGLVLGRLAALSLACVPGAALLFLYHVAVD